jgi:hypothetical protein
MMRLPILAAILLAPFAVAAQPASDPVSPPRVIDMTVVLMDLHGKPLMEQAATAEDPKCEKCTPLTLGSAVSAALLTPRREDQGGSGFDAGKRLWLAEHLQNNKAATLTQAQGDMIVSRAGSLPPIIAGRLVQLIDPAVDLSK